MSIPSLSEHPIHTISIVTAHKPGALVRIATVFSRRGFNIESLVVSRALDGRFARMTITAAGPEKTLEQIIKQLNKLVDVIHADEHRPSETYESELALIKVRAETGSRPEILQLVGHFEGHTVDFTEGCLIVQVTGPTDKLNSFVELVKPYGILEIVRTGKVLMMKGVMAT